ncbi:MAG: hypothetical protein WAK23_22155 [Terriglobales bacterium]
MAVTARVELVPFPNLARIGAFPQPLKPHPFKTILDYGAAEAALFQNNSSYAANLWEAALAQLRAWGSQDFEVARNTKSRAFAPGVSY